MPVWAGMRKRATAKRAVLMRVRRVRSILAALAALDGGDTLVDQEEVGVNIFAEGLHLRLYVFTQNHHLGAEVADILTLEEDADEAGDGRGEGGQGSNRDGSCRVHPRLR